MTTIYEVAAHAGVSPATVSRVLNGNRAVNGAMAERVRTSIDELGYRPSQVARSLRTQRSRTIAVIVPDIENPFFTSVVRGTEDEGRGAGLMTVVCNTDNDVERERGYLRLAVDQRMDGVILATDQHDLGEFMTTRGPAVTTVLIDRELDSLRLDAVLVDNVLGAKEATRHLIESGAHRVACITGPANVTTATQRLQGYQEAMREAGIRRDRSLVRHADYHSAGGRSAMAELMAAGRPDGVLVCNNMMTMGALQELSDQGVAVPGDLLLVGFDDEPWAPYWQPPVTTVAQPARDVGRSAIRLLLDRIADADGAPRRIMLLPSLQVRASSQHPRQRR